MTHFQPLNDFCLIEIVPDTATHGLIIIPGIVQKKQLCGKVILVGPKVKILRPDDRVIMPYYVGTEFNIDGVPHVVVNEQSIFVVFDQLKS